MSEQQKVNGNSKNEQLEQFRSKDEGHALTTNQGLKVSEDEFSLKAGDRTNLAGGFSFSGKNDPF